MYDQNIVHTLYKRLLALYPRGFRERLGESMEQTFSDLYNERRRQTERGLFGFVLWTFVETAIGIVQEHIFLIKEMNPMKNILTDLRLPAIISFLIVLPFQYRTELMCRNNKLWLVDLRFVLSAL
jgi:hypothetical protein